MGLLDDAIREHLELKRRSGADPGDVARLEHEAFGAGSDEPAVPAEHDEPREEPHDDVHAEPEHEHEHEPEPEPYAVHEPEHEPEPEPEPYAVHEPEHEPEPEPEPEHAPLPEPDQPTRQFTAQELEEAERPGSKSPPREPEPEPPAVPGEHDELEETPDFLQETPEHDRLWFEQKPPKDFDF